MEWILQIPSMVFTRIKTEFPEELKQKYNIKNDNFSTVNALNTTPTFPFVYVQNLPGAEQGQDLENKTINGALFTFQIDVTDNKSQTRVREVMSEVIKSMKNMRFEVNSMPSFEKQENLYRMSARFRRLIGSGDIL